MQRLNSDIEAGEKLITQRLTVLERLISYGFYWRDPEDIIEILIHILKKEVHVQSTGNSLCCCVISNVVACCLSRLFIVTKIVYLCVNPTVRYLHHSCPAFHIVYMQFSFNLPDIC